jgi:hypothetical protein
MLAHGGTPQAIAGPLDVVDPVGVPDTACLHDNFINKMLRCKAIDATDAQTQPVNGRGCILTCVARHRVS